MDKNKLHSIARESVQRLDSTELPLFEPQWAEALQNDALLMPDSGKRDKELGMGSAADVSLVSTIVIPLVIGIGKDLAVYSVKQIIEYARKWLEKRRYAAPKAVHPSDEEIERIARVIAECAKEKR